MKVLQQLDDIKLIWIAHYLKKRQESTKDEGLSERRVVYFR